MKTNVKNLTKDKKTEKDSAQNAVNYLKLLLCIAKKNPKIWRKINKDSCKKL